MLAEHLGEYYQMCSCQPKTRLVTLIRKVKEYQNTEFKTELLIQIMKNNIPNCGLGCEGITSILR